MVHSFIDLRICLFRYVFNYVFSDLFIDWFICRMSSYICICLCLHKLFMYLRTFVVIVFFCHCMAMPSSYQWTLNKALLSASRKGQAGEVRRLIGTILWTYRKSAGKEGLILFVSKNVFRTWSLPQKCFLRKNNFLVLLVQPVKILIFCCVQDLHADVNTKMLVHIYII